MLAADFDENKYPPSPLMCMKSSKVSIGVLDQLIFVGGSTKHFSNNPGSFPIMQKLLNIFICLIPDAEVIRNYELIAIASPLFSAYERSRRKMMMRKIRKRE